MNRGTSLLIILALAASACTRDGKQEPTTSAQKEEMISLGNSETTTLKEKTAIADSLLASAEDSEKALYNSLIAAGCDKVEMYKVAINCSAEKISGGSEWYSGVMTQIYNSEQSWNFLARIKNPEKVFDKETVVRIRKNQSIAKARREQIETKSVAEALEGSQKLKKAVSEIEDQLRSELDIRFMSVAELRQMDKQKKQGYITPVHGNNAPGNINILESSTDLDVRRQTTYVLLIPAVLVFKAPSAEDSNVETVTKVGERVKDLGLAYLKVGGDLSVKLLSASRMSQSEALWKESLSLRNKISEMSALTVSLLPKCESADAEKGTAANAPCASEPGVSGYSGIIFDRSK